MAAFPFATSSSSDLPFSKTKTARNYFPGRFFFSFTFCRETPAKLQPFAPPFTPFTLTKVLGGRGWGLG
ncbi:hypothetical protein, partial [Bilophila wadsworthia]|uniref:hypothetical protein n=1 Tax=Bilophila wadsworthia TaxID=35833 RepID=UPI001D0AA504